ncbi:MAG: anti-sigma factor family protein [Thermodesulfobacteriota bacterium]
MKCDQASDLFIEYADQALPPATKAALEHHLAGCPDCAAQWRDYRQAVQLLHALPPVEPPADLLASIQARLDRRKSLGARLRELVDHLSFPVPLPAAVTVFAVAMLAGYLAQQPVPTMPDGTVGTSTARQANGMGTLPAPLFAMTHPAQTPPRLALSTHPQERVGVTEQTAGRMFSPDLGVIFHQLAPPARKELCRELVERHWRVRHIEQGLLVQLPAEQLPELHALLADHPFSLVPGEAARPGFGHGKPVLTAVLRFP